MEKDVIIVMNQVPVEKVVTFSTERTPTGKTTLTLSSGRKVTIPNTEVARLEKEKKIRIEEGTRLIIHDGRLRFITSNNLTVIGIQAALMYRNSIVDGDHPTEFEHLTSTGDWRIGE